MKSGAGKLTPKQSLFTKEYLIDLNGTKAAIRAGYSKKTARIIAAQNLAKPSIQGEIERLMDARGKRVEIRADQVLERLYKLGFYDVRKLFDAKGNAKNIHELDDDTAPAVTGFDFVTLYDGSGDEKHAFGQLRKLRLANPKDSLELLGRHLGLFKDKLEISTKDEFEGKTAEELEHYAINGKWPEPKSGATSKTMPCKEAK